MQTRTALFLINHDFLLSIITASIKSDAHDTTKLFPFSFFMTVAYMSDLIALPPEFYKSLYYYYYYYYDYY